MNNTNLIRQLAEEGMRINGDNPFDLFVEDGKIYQHHAEDLSEPWEPTRDWDDCMGLVGEMREKGYRFELKIEIYSLLAKFFNPVTWKEGTNYRTNIDEAQTAICMAAAKALGIDVE